MVKWMLGVVFEDNLVSEIGTACLVEIGCKSGRMDLRTQKGKNNM